MKSIILPLIALAYAPSAFAADTANAGSAIAPQDSFVQVKLTTSMSVGSSKPGEPVTAVVMGPSPVLLGARVEGTVDLAEKNAIAFSFHTLIPYGQAKAYRIHSRTLAYVNSKGVAGQDELGQRIRIEGNNIVAYGTTTALNDGAEVRLSIWKD